MQGFISLKRLRWDHPDFKYVVGCPVFWVLVMSADSQKSYSIEIKRSSLEKLTDQSPQQVKSQLKQLEKRELIETKYTKVKGFQKVNRYFLNQNHEIFKCLTPTTEATTEATTERPHKQRVRSTTPTTDPTTDPTTILTTNITTNNKLPIFSKMTRKQFNKWFSENGYSEFFEKIWKIPHAPRDAKKGAFHEYMKAIQSGIKKEDIYTAWKNFADATDDRHFQKHFKNFLDDDMVEGWINPKLPTKSKPSRDYGKDAKQAAEVLINSYHDLFEGGVKVKDDPYFAQALCKIPDPTFFDRDDEKIKSSFINLYWEAVKEKKPNHFPIFNPEEKTITVWTLYPTEQQHVG